MRRNLFLTFIVSSLLIIGCVPSGKAPAPGDQVSDVSVPDDVTEPVTTVDVTDPEPEPVPVDAGIDPEPEPDVTEPPPKPKTLCDATCEALGKTDCDNTPKTKEACAKTCDEMTNSEECGEYLNAALDCAVQTGGFACKENPNVKGATMFFPVEEECGEIFMKGLECEMATTGPDKQKLCEQNYCKTVLQNCTEEFAIYDSPEECIKTCMQWPFGDPTDTKGNSIACRIYHAGAAADDPKTHCSHASPEGGGVCVDP